MSKGRMKMLVYRHDDNLGVVITENAYLKKRAEKEAELLEKFSDVSPEETRFFDDMDYRYSAFDIWHMTEEQKEKIWQDYIEELIDDAMKDWESLWAELTLEIEGE